MDDYDNAAAVIVTLMAIRLLTDYDYRILDEGEIKTVTEARAIGDPRDSESTSPMMF